jgi:hypothetical protein
MSRVHQLGGLALVGLLALSSVARADGPTDARSERDAALHARLLGPLQEAEPGSVAPSASRAARGPSTAWMVGLGVLALGLAGVRKPLLAAVRSSAVAGDEALMTVVAREKLGGFGGAGGVLTLIDVQDAAGETRRLLVGASADGPQLVADLSAFPDGSFAGALDQSLHAEEA